MPSWVITGCTGGCGTLVALMTSQDILRKMREQNALARTREPVNQKGPVEKLERLRPTQEALLDPRPKLAISSGAVAKQGHKAMR